MARFTMKQAAETVGKGKTTIYRDIKAGRLSASLDEHGRYWIDAAELHRVYAPTVPVERATSIPDGTAMALLEKEVEHLRAMLERERQLSAELSRRLDAESDERRKLTAILTHQGKAEGEPASASDAGGSPPPWGRWWPWSR